MEVEGEGGGGEGKPAPEAWKKTPEAGEKPAKRKMKSPYQLEMLEQAYAVETYPSEATRAELSAKIGLSDRQLQMWFCHRRLKDRKFPPTKRARKDEEPMPPPAPIISPQLGNEVMASGSMSVGSSGNPYAGSVEPRKAVGRAVAVPRIGVDMPLGKRYYETPSTLAPPLPPPTPQLSMSELRVIASVEAQLGEPLRDDGPVLGVEFDPLPPGAFGAPIAMPVQQKQPMRPYNGKLFERHESKSIKTSTLLPSMEHCFLPSSSSGKRKLAGAGAHSVHSQGGPRALHEYQFLPEQPSIRSETYDRVPQSQFYDSAIVGPSSRVPSLPTGGQYLHGNEQMAPTYTFQGQMSSANHLSQQGRQQIFSSGSAEYDSAPHSNSFTNATTDTQFGIHQVIGSDNPFLPSDRRVYRDEDVSRVEKKRKSEEARIAKEVEAHEKRIRKELEKQDILRRKREEQMRREMERHDRERRKEEERMMREKQREEERFQREQRREIERKEKFLQKEFQRAEKMKQKEELRREKEAARLKAANERATARRIAREYMELVEDERLELMELAASSKGLPSIVSLDGETLQQLDMFRDILSAFPPKSVQLKRPFAIQPWTGCEENIGNLLMVWKFLITFTDVLGLWPFTLDEFVQSLHDYDSRLLGEIHVALLKSIIKDIEDVARTPAVALGANQNSVANPGGGHPQIVEGAYAWGFDIRSWQRHLSFLTWPEILRQFALSAGFGPQLKKRNVERAYFRDDNEGNDGEDVISTLRNGAAAENAVALMQEKGYSHRRRSRHRLTPGTVKFAAFHVLSLEGSRGLTILEVADKIQKSGLRDLTTSKTPEASIAAALSRDTKLFERTAPSTYCVRPAYRKDPADADAILSAAREKIQVFQNGLSDSEEAEKDIEDADDAERDEDSECEGADDPEVEDAATEAKLNRDVLCSTELKDSRAMASLDSEKGEVVCDAVGVTPQSSLRNADQGFSVLSSENSKGMSVPQSLDMSSNVQGAANVEVEGTEIDESNFGEPWVQGLTEGDYSDLSVEERLNALVSLIGVAIEGNTIRVILEERLEAATALKKQMWAEAQLDKRRYKEEQVSRIQFSSFTGYRTEAAQTNATLEGSQTPVHVADNKANDLNPVSASNDQFLDPQFQSNVNNMSAERNLLGQEFSATPDSVPLQPYGYAAEKSRSQLKAYIGHKAEQLYVYRSLPLGQDRRRNRYWIFSTSSSPNDPGSGRIFFESKEGFWRIIDSEEAFDSLLAVLDTRGARESHLHSMLQRIESTFKEAIRRNKKLPTCAGPAEGLIKNGVTEMTSSPDCNAEFDSPSSTLCGLTSDAPECSTSFRIELGHNEAERNAALKRYQGFLNWLWKECYNPFTLCAMKYGKKRCSELLQICHMCYQSYFSEERHCPSCHKTFKTINNIDANFSEHMALCEMKRKMDPDWKIHVPDSSLPMGIQLLKAQLSLIEVSLPAEALQPFWTEGYRKSWGVKLHLSSSAEDLFQLLTLLESAIKRDCLSSNFETTNELLRSSKASSSAESTSISGSVPVLPWVPDTIAAVSLRLLDLDASISYMLHQKLESHKEKEAGDFIKLPSRYTVVKNFQELEPSDALDQADYLREARWLDPGSGRRGRGRGSRGRGGRGRGRGGRGSRGNGSTTARVDYTEENAGNYGKATRKYTRRGGRARGRGRRRGRRTVRPRQIPETRVAVSKVPSQLSGFINDVGISAKQESSEESSRSLAGDDWGLETARRPYVEDDDNSAGSQSDDNGQASGDEYEDQTTGYVRNYDVGKSMGLMDDESEDDDDDGDGDEDGEDVDHRIIHDDMDVDDEDEEDMGDDEGEEIGGDGNGDDDDGASSFSSGYSD